MSLSPPTYGRAMVQKICFFIKCLTIKNHIQQSKGHQTSLYQMGMKGQEQGEQVVIFY
jgi:hypothetical protein